MSDITKIEWTDHTFNPWWGCSRVSPACVHCYADSTARRWGHELWRRNGERRMLSEQNWRHPLRWNRDAERAGVPAKVFCASMADVFEDHPALAEPRKRLWGLIESTPWLRWQLLTKRPENVAAMAPWGGDWPSWAWLGVSAETQRWADTRIPVLVALPARVRFISAEPLLGPVDFSAWMPAGDARWQCGACRWFFAGEWRERCPQCGGDGCFSGSHAGNGRPGGHQLSWIIVGGESGSRPRPMELSWAAGIVSQCRASQVPVFVKQLGSVRGCELDAGRKGGDMGRWPAGLRVREFPRDAGLVQAEIPVS
jgi:protein gp37